MTRERIAELRVLVDSLDDVITMDEKWELLRVIDNYVKLMDYSKHHFMPSYDDGDTCGLCSMYFLNEVHIRW